MAKKVKFKEYQKKRTDGFIENIICAYFDVTSEVKDMLGTGVKKAILIAEEYYEGYGDLDEWKSSVRNKQEQYNISKERIGVDGTFLYVEMTNGNAINFSTSEWGYINKSRMPW